MSAPTKCDKCGTTGTFAISAPCAMQCGGTMHYASSDAGRSEGPWTTATVEQVRAVAEYAVYVAGCATGPVTPVSLEEWTRSVYGCPFEDLGASSAGASQRGGSNLE